MIKINNYINGEFQPAKHFLEDLNPATGEVIAKIPKSGLNEVEKAVNAADEARTLWSNIGLEERADWPK